jgi:hypothetical protein
MPHAACPCPFCLSMSTACSCHDTAWPSCMFTLHVHVRAECLCPCCTSMSVLHVYALVACSCPCYMFISGLHACRYCMFISMLHIHIHERVYVHAVCSCPQCISIHMLHVYISPCSCPFWISMSVPYVHVNDACPCLHAAYYCICPCCMSILHFKPHVLLHICAACPWCLSMVLVHHACPFWMSIRNSNAGYLCFMSMLDVYISMQHVHAAFHAAYPCCISMLRAHASCPCLCAVFSLLHIHAACPHCMSMSHDHTAWTCCENMKMKQNLNIKMKMNMIIKRKMNVKIKMK